MTSPRLEAWLSDTTPCSNCGHQRSWHRPDWLPSDLNDPQCNYGRTEDDSCPCGWFEAS